MRRNTRPALLVAAAIIATAPPAHAQQPVFRSGTSIVEVTVIVRDRAGTFVHGLTPDDFVLIEAGQPRKIELMYLVTGAEPAATAAAFEKAPRPESRQAGRTFVFAFDLAQMSPRSFTRAREAAVGFVKQRLSPSDFSGLAVLGAGSSGRVSHTHDDLIAHLQRLKPVSDLVSRDRPLREWPRILGFQEAADIASGVGKALEDARERSCREQPLSCVALADRELIEVELRSKARDYIAASRTAALRSIGALESLARALEAIRGRKTIVWFTEGTPMLDVANQARDAAARAAQSGVAVYTIDPRGLQSRTADIYEVGVEEMGLDVLKDTGDLPSLMASGTGGLFIRNENRLDRALATIEDDTSSYYVIGYVADEAGARSNRRLDLRVTRQGLTARVRYGFMAPQHVMTTVGSMVAMESPVVPGTRSELSAPANVPTVPARPTSPPSTLTTPPTRTHVPTTASNVLRLRGASSETASDLAARGWAAYERGDLEAALPLLEQAASRRDVRPWTLYALGFTYVGLNRPRDAVAVWERVRAAAPDFTPVYLDLAAHYAQMSDVTDALALLREAAKRWPSNPDAHNGIGVLLVRRGALDDAIVSFRKATEVAPDDALGWLNLGRAYEVRHDRARRYDEQLLKWVGPESDRVKAKQSYERCVKLGGPYALQAADALARMDWSE